MAYNPVNPNGSATSANSAPVVIASDQASVSVKQATAANLNTTVVPAESTGSAVPSVALPIGVQAVSADPTATTTTYNTIPIADLAGKQVVMPYALSQNFQSGTASATGTSSTSLIPLVSSNKIYLTQVTVVNTGSTTTYVNLQDGSGGTTKYVVPAPAGGGSVVNLPTPIGNTSGNGWYFAAGNANTTLYVSATGYASKV